MKSYNENMRYVSFYARIILFAAIIIGIGALMNLLGIFDFIINLVIALSPLLLAYTVALILNPLVNIIVSKTRINRVIASFLAVFGFFIFSLIIIIVFLPLFVVEINKLNASLPDISKGIIAFIETIESYFDTRGININLVNVTEKFEGNTGIEQTLAVISGILETLAGLTFQIIFSLILAMLILTDYVPMNLYIRRFVPLKYQFGVQNYFEDMSYYINRYIYGVVLNSIIVGILTIFAYMLLGLENAFILGAFVGAANAILYVGPYIGTLPPLLFAFASGNATLVILVIVVTLGIHFIENATIKKKIITEANTFKPQVAILGFLLSVQLFGLVGIFIAHPLVIFISVTFNHLNMKFNFYDADLQE